LFVLDGDLLGANTGFDATFDISSDGLRFLMAGSAGRASRGKATLLLVDNWFEEVKAQMKGER
jgi:hypothetical protein